MSISWPCNLLLIKPLLFFSSLSPPTDTVSMDLIRPVNYKSLTLVVPIVCAVIVLTVISFVAFFVLCKQRSAARGPLGDHQAQSPAANGFHAPHLSNERFMSSDGIQLVIRDPRKDIINECCSSDVRELPTKEHFMSASYGMPIQQDRNTRMQLYSTFNKQPHVSFCKEPELSLPTTVKQRNFNDEQHLYDMPTKPKWV